MDLPQEIIDEVIDNLAFDFATLKFTSLVRKSWTHRSRRRLFYFVPINSLTRLEQWSLSISSDPEGIASYTRVVHLSHDTPRSWVEPANLDRFYDHFRSFPGVERLVISGLHTTKFGATSIPHYFANFTATVRSLELRTAVGTADSFLSFICAFPLVDDLAIEFPNAIGGGWNNRGVMNLASVPRFRGKLRLLDMFHESSPLVELLCAVPLPFHTISVSSRNPGGLPQLAKLVSKCGKTVRSLHITSRAREDLLGLTGASLASCVVLEELRITVMYPKHLVTMLGGILPTLPKTGNLLRIVLDAEDSLPEEDVDKATWSSLDGVMSECAEKVSAKHRNRRLALQFRTGEEGATGERDRWARELVDLLVSLPKVGHVEYISKY